MATKQSHTTVGIESNIIILLPLLVGGTAYFLLFLKSITYGQRVKSWQHWQQWQQIPSSQRTAGACYVANTGNTLATNQKPTAQVRDKKTTSFSLQVQGQGV